MQSAGAATSTFQALRTTLRPPRAAVLFNGDGDWLSHAAQALYECGRVWGGSGFILIPHHKGHVLPALVRLAAAYDPDYVLTVQTTVAQQEAIYPGLMTVRDETGDLLHGEERADALRPSLEQPLRDPNGYTARDLVAAACTPHRYMLPGDKGSEEPHEQWQVLSLREDGFGGHEPLSPAPAPSGGSPRTESGVPPGVQGVWGLAAAIRYGFEEPPTLPFADTSAVSFETAKSIIRQALPPTQRIGLFDVAGEPWTSAWVPSEAGTVRVGPWQTSRKHNLVVMGRSADDFALALGWHVLFGNSYWVPEEYPLSEQVNELISWNLGQDMLSEMEFHHRQVVLTSTTLADDQLLGVADDWIDRRPRLITSWGTAEEADEDEDIGAGQVRPRLLGPDELDYADGRLLVVHDQYDVPLALPATTDEHGQIQLLVDLPPLAPAHPDLDGIPNLTWQIDVDTPDFRAPRMRGVPPSVLQHGESARESFVRSSRGGLSCYSASWGFVTANSTRIQAMARPRLQFPSMLTWTAAMASAHDFSTRFSPAGYRVEVLRRLWGGRRQLTNDWSGPLRPILLAFHNDAKLTSEAFPAHDGVVLRNRDAYLSFAAMTRLCAVSDEEATVELRRHVDRLCGLGVLRRGLILRCGSCLVLNFVTVDDVGSTNGCPRCGAASPLAQATWGHPVNEPTWWYDLHPAARELLAADAGVGLLAAQHLRSGSRSYDDVSEIEFLSGPDPVAEVDLLAAMDGRVVLGEAKATPRLGTRKERTAKARKLAMVAAAVRADDLLLCTTSSSSWSAADVEAISAALAEAIPDAALRPTIRALTGLGSAPTERQAQTTKEA